MRYLLMSLVLLGVATAGVKAPSGEVRAPNKNDLKPHEWSDKLYNEFWTYNFTFKDGSKLHFNMSRANLGSFKDPVGGCDVSLMNFKGKTYTLAREYPKKKFKWTDSESKLEVAPTIWFKGLPPQSHQVYLETSKKGVDWLIDLKLSNISSSLVKGNGVSKVGKYNVGQVIHIPTAHVSGVIAINGDTVQVNGKVSMAHAWQNNLAPEIVSHGFQWRVGSSSNGSTGYILSTSKKQPVGYVIDMKAGVPNYVEVQSLKVAKSKKYSGVKWWENWSYVSGEKNTEVVIKSPWQRLSVLSEFEGFTKWAVKSFMGGEIVNFRGTAVVDGATGTYNSFYIK